MAIGAVSPILSRLKPWIPRAGRRALLAICAALVLAVINLVAALLPESNPALVWYIPVVDSATVVMLIVVLVLASTDVILRRHGRLLTMAASSLALTLVWLAHGLTFPGVLPATMPLITSQTAVYVFHLGHMATPGLIVWILMQPTGAIQHPRQALIKALAAAATISLSAIGVVMGLAIVLPPLFDGRAFTELNTIFQTGPFFIVGIAAALYKSGRHPERKVEWALITALVLIAIESLVLILMHRRYDGFWYVGHGLLVLPYAALLGGTVSLFIAARRDAEVQLRVLERVRESQQRLRVIVDTSPSAVITANEQGVITGWNRKAEAMFGWSHDEAVGRTLTGTIIPPRYRDSHQRSMARFASTGQGRIIGRTVEFAALHRDGHQFPVEVSVSATERAGARVSFVAFVNDISQRRAGERMRSVQFAVTRPLAGSATWKDAAPQVLQGLGETLGCLSAEFWAVDQEAGILRWAHGWYRGTRDLDELKASVDLTCARGVGFLGRIWATGKPRTSEDLDSPRGQLATKAGAKSRFGFAVMNDRAVTGVISLFSEQRKPLDRPALRVMADIGSQIGHFIERRRAEEELRRSGDRIRAILDNVADGIITVDERLVVRSYNPAAQRLFGYAPEEVIGKDFTRLVGEPFRAEMRPQLRNYLSASQQEVVVATHETGGRTKDGREFPLEFNVSRLGPQRLVIGSLRDVSERKAETEALQFQALHDPLTGLPNRTLVRERLEETLRAGEREMRPCAVLLLDLDGFKSVNDSLGHEAGDRLLQQVSQRLRSVLRKADTVGRYGGDEFAIVPLGATDVARAVLIAEKILQAVGKPFTIDDQPVNVRLSIGIAVFPQHAEDSDALIRRADLAMYAAKRAQSGFSVYSADQEGGDQAGRIPLIGKLRYAIDQFELLLHYQPIVAASDGRPVKVEALVRWGHPSHGLLPPDDFIPSAEQTNLIRPLTAWVLNEAIGQVHAWSRTGIDIAVAVNLSARNLLDEELPDAVIQLLRTWQVEPDKLWLEITESTIIATEALETLQRLRDAGVRISVDDFGTGYSSLAYLKWLPVNEIKIDRSFVHDMATNLDGAAIVRSTIDLGHNLGLKVVAEGIEEEATANLLRQYGCDYLQGFLISRPAAAGPLGPWLRAKFGLNGVAHGTLTA